MLSPGGLATIKSGLRGTSGQVFSSRREATGGAGVRGGDGGGAWGLLAGKYANRLLLDESANYSLLGDRRARGGQSAPGLRGQRQGDGLVTFRPVCLAGPWFSAFMGCPCLLSWLGLVARAVSPLEAGRCCSWSTDWLLPRRGSGRVSKGQLGWGGGADVCCVWPGTCHPSFSEGDIHSLPVLQRRKWWCGQRISPRTGEGRAETQTKV